MIRTVFSLDSVPSNWVFEHYCRLQQKLHGQDLTIKSIFGEERTPSMCIYYDGKNYKFKDFSSGNQGDGIDLVMKIHRLVYHEAVSKILTDYKNKEQDFEEVLIKKASKFKVTSHLKRKWNELDAKFWTQFNIGSIILGKYNVFPLSQYTMSKSGDDGIEEMLVNGQHIYGFFKENGELYKVYQPYKMKMKFNNVLSYIQGSEQLTYEAPVLVICSSLKDIMALDTLNFNIECVAPSSENSMIANSVLSAYSLKYKGIITFFDNDIAGKTGMEKYEEMYGIPGIYLKMSKDLSDSIRDFGPEKVKQYLTPLIPTT